MRVQVLRAAKWRGMRWAPGSFIEGDETALAPLVASGAVRSVAAEGNAAQGDARTAAPTPASGGGAEAAGTAKPRKPRKSRKAKE